MMLRATMRPCRARPHRPGSPTTSKPRRFLSAALAVLLVGLAAARPAPAAGGPDAPKGDTPQTPPTRAEIDRLVTQLGSPSFAEREAAGKALEAIGKPALEALRTATRGEDAEVRRRAAALVRVLENRLDALLNDYRVYGLPLPPRDAPLVRFFGGMTRRGADYSGLGFLVRPARAWEEPPRMNCWTGSISLWKGEPTEVVVPANGTPGNPEEVLRGYRSSPDEVVGLAVQCQARGWTALAQAVLRQGLQEDPASVFLRQLRGEPEGLSLKTRLARFAWRYWDNQLSEPDTDWASIGRRLRALLAAERNLDTEDNRALLRSLDRSLAPTKDEPGSAAAAINGLMRARSTDLWFHETPDPFYLRVVNLGFAAVPDLIDHLDDIRLTRCRAPVPFVEGVGESGAREQATYHRCVGDLAGELLETLSGEDLGAGLLRCLTGDTVPKAEARAWWARARQTGEEAYLLANTLPTRSDERFPNLPLLRLAVHEYPLHLPRLYRHLLKDRPNVVSEPLVDAIAASSLPRARQAELFREGARHEDPNHRKPALWQLKDVEPAAFTSLLTQTLNDLPKRLTQDNPAGEFARLAVETDDPAVWQALERAARRADAGLRLELLDHAAAPDIGARQRDQRLAFLAAFLNDPAASVPRAHPGVSWWPHDVRDFPRLEVRDFAALKVAQILKTPAEPKPDWKPEQWARLRTQVREALRRQR